MKTKIKVAIGIGMMLVVGLFSNCKKENMEECTAQNSQATEKTMQFNSSANSSINPNEFYGISFTQSADKHQTSKYEYNWVCSGMAKVDKIEFQNKINLYQSKDVIVGWHTSPGDEIIVNQESKDRIEFSKIKIWNDGGVDASVRLKITLKDKSVIYSNELKAEIFGLNKRICTKASCWP